MLLRPYQDKAIDDIRIAFKSGAKSVCYVLSTGAGKTPIIAEIARRAADAGTSVVILVHRDTLLTQCAQKLQDAGAFYSTIAAGYEDTGNLIRIASKDTLVRRLDQYKFDFIICDEAHRIVAPSYQKIIAANPNAYILGVTATPQRTDGRGLDSVFQSLVRGPSMRVLIDAKYLSQPVTYGPLQKPDLSRVRTIGGDYDPAQLAEVMNQQKITGDCIREYSRHCPGEPAMVFCVSIKHAEDVARNFKAAGYHAEHVSGAMPRELIRDRIAALGDGRLHVLTSCDLASEGVDIGIVRASILLRPTKSLIVYLQQAGRALRPHKNKINSLILDHAGSFLKFGMIDDERHWTLEGRRKREKKISDIEVDIAVRQCPTCYMAHSPLPVCPGCGHVYEIAQRIPKQVEGDLSLIDPIAFRLFRKAEERAAHTYQDFVAIGRRRGYKSGWAWHRWKARAINP